MQMVGLVITALIAPHYPGLVCGTGNTQSVQTWDLGRLVMTIVAGVNSLLIVQSIIACVKIAQPCQIIPNHFRVLAGNAVANINIPIILPEQD